MRFSKRIKLSRWANLVVVNLRILLGFAFLPAGLKKVLGQRFTDLENVGPFHDFLDAFYDTGPFYSFVGVVQLVVAALLMTQTYAPLGALLALPVFTTILVFCWSTQVYPTAVMVSLMWLAVIGLLLWDIDRLRPLVAPADARPQSPSAGATEAPTAALAPVDLRLWRLCGVGVLGLYLATCLLAGGIYRPRGVELDNPAFYTLPSVALLPIITLVVEWRRRRRLGG